ncbi:hypothetical protein BDQ17DRAFT_194672 [Cyathus striatus]|nr:hypothetical protein BDQ17DRAFT_194672 [Cyathus striatus]
MHAEQLRSEVSELSSGRRPSMPILTAEQTFSLSKGGPNMLVMEHSTVRTAANTKLYQFPTQLEESKAPIATTSSQLSRKDTTSSSTVGISTGPQRSNSASVMHAAPTSDMKHESKDLRRAQRPQLSVATSSNYEQSETDVIMSPGPDTSYPKPSKRKFMRRVRSGSSLKSAAEEPTSPVRENVTVVKKSRLLWPMALRGS